MLVSKLIPQVDPQVKIGSAKVSRKKTRKDYTFSLKLAKSQKGNFEQPPHVTCLHSGSWVLSGLQIILGPVLVLGGPNKVVYFGLPRPQHSSAGRDAQATDGAAYFAALLKPSVRHFAVQGA